jgi:RND superfamily putative drug exporter
VNGPLTVLLTGDGAVETAAQARAGIAALDDVVLVTEPVPSPGGGAALLSVVPESGPATQATEHLVADLRAELAGLEGVEPPSPAPPPSASTSPRRSTPRCPST